LAQLPTADRRVETSVFGQLFNEVDKWSEQSLRRAYVGKGHGGQKRAFKVKFLGEGVKDYGGPYRAVFDQVSMSCRGCGMRCRAGRQQPMMPLNWAIANSTKCTRIELSFGLCACVPLAIWVEATAVPINREQHNTKQTAFETPKR